MDLVRAAWAHIQTRTSFGSERGASLVEYALLLAFIAMICIGAISVIGSVTDASLSEAGSKLQ